jgi:hypothetical protein
MAPAPERAPADAARLQEALILSGLLSIALVLFYSVLFPIKGIRIPAWSDAQTYIWWARRAGVLGLAAFGTGTRPVTVGLVSTLSTLVHVPVEGVVEAIGLVLAVAVGLAAGAASESVLGPHRVRFALAAVLTGTFISQLVTSFFATLAFAAMFLAALTYCSEGLGTRRARAFAAAGVLFGAAALAHPAFVGLEIGLLLGGLVTLAVFRPRGRADADGEGRIGGDPAWSGWGLAIGIGVAVTGLGLFLARSGSGPPLDTSADAVLRRLGLGALYRKTYRDTLSAYLPIFIPTAIAAALAFALVPKGAWASSPAKRRMFGGLVSVWLAGTVVAILLLLLGLRIPAQRLVALCLPLPLLIAVGVANVDPGWRARPVTVAIVGALFVGVAFLVPRYWVAWESQRPNSARAVADAQLLGRVLAREPAGTPLILVANDPRDGPSFFHVTRLASYLRDGVPPARVPDVHVFVGTAQDFLAARPTLTGKVGRDRMATDYWNRIRAVLDRPALAVAIASFDPAEYRHVLGMSGHMGIAPGIVALPGFTGAGRGLPSASAELTSAGAGPLSPWLPVWLAPLVVILVGLIGWPWVAATLPGANPRIRVGLAPAVGIAALSLAAIAADALGMRLNGWGAVVAAIAAWGTGLVLLAGSGRGRGDAAPRDRIPDVNLPVGSSLAQR